MITGMGIPSSQSSSPRPIVRFPELLQYRSSRTTRFQRTGGIGHAANATGIQLHLAITNEIREPLVPLTPESVGKEEKAHGVGNRCRLANDFTQ
jgi:hypothetical protein